MAKNAENQVENLKQAWSDATDDEKQLFVQWVGSKVRSSLSEASKSLFSQQTEDAETPLHPAGSH